MTPIIITIILRSALAVTAAIVRISIMKITMKKMISDSNCTILEAIKYR